LSAAELKDNHPKLLGNVSVQTIQNRLQKELDQPSRCAAQKPLLTKEMVRKHLQFARRYRNWTKEQWAKVVWSDESNFSLVQKGRKHVRRPSSRNRFDAKYTQKTVRHPASVMVWACFSGGK
jgi:hypothetical protein